ncbi:hypothetical protein BDZ88DRAFT_440157 [Geranomyces variabilis]|nr:hypothetical protein BDZ88DRAFT_440157 [Geranomyces variabilis]
MSPTSKGLYFIASARRVHRAAAARRSPTFAVNWLYKELKEFMAIANEGKGTDVVFKWGRTIDFVDRFTKHKADFGAIINTKPMLVKTIHIEDGKGAARAWGASSPPGAMNEEWETALERFLKHAAAAATNLATIAIAGEREGGQGSGEGEGPGADIFVVWAVVLLFSGHLTPEFPTAVVSRAERAPLAARRVPPSCTCACP